MSESNLVDFSKLKKMNELKEKEVKIKAYLSSLKQEDLQYEANYLMNKMQIDKEVDQTSLLKSALLMDELAKRVTVKGMSSTITQFAQDIKMKMHTNSSEITIH